MAKQRRNKKSEVVVYETDIEDLKFDTQNVNKHTSRGMELLGKSIEEFGAGRSVLTSSDGVLIAGNGVVEKAKESGYTKVITIETDGTTLVNVKRTDIKAKSKKAKNLALADNRVAQTNLFFDYDKIKELYSYNDLAKFDLQNLFGAEGGGTSAPSSGSSTGSTDTSGELCILIICDSLKDQEESYRDLKKAGYEVEIYAR